MLTFRPNVPENAQPGPNIPYNYFRFEDHYFLQTRGAAMGTATAPAYVSLVVAHWEEELIYNR